jgi:hypothetical protein
MAVRLDDTTRIAKPAARPLQVYAFDPSAGRYVGNNMVVHARFEELTPGPVGERFAVVDYNASEKVYYEPVDLNDPHIIMRSGLDPLRVRSPISPTNGLRRSQRNTAAF